MTTDRRHEPRVPCVLDATWNGQSGARPCRVTDLSWHGCFVESVIAPSVASETLVTLTIGNDRLEIKGRVQYVEPRMGFGVTFDALGFSQATAMALVLRVPVGATA